MNNSTTTEFDTDDELYEHHRFDVPKGQSMLRIDKYLMQVVENATRIKFNKRLRLEIFWSMKLR